MRTAGSAIALLCSVGVFAQIPADQPVARTDQNSLTAHAQLLEKAKQGRIDIYFEGDSITRRWGATDYPELLANWNQNLSQLADGKKIRYLNINSRLADSDGKLVDGMMNADKLHPAIPGYQVWADALKPIFTELLGPAAEQDHAPPPTGDPNARR